MPDPKKLGPEGMRVHPKLRMIRNGSATVNALRAEHAGCLRVSDPALAEDVPCLRGDDAVPLIVDEVTGPLKKRKLRRVPPDIDVSLFVTLSDDAASWQGIRDGHFSAATGTLRTASRPLNQIKSLLDLPDVQFVEPGEALRSPTPEIATASDEPSVGRWQFGTPEEHGDGAGVLIGIIDVQGFDFAHPDFLGPDGHTRWERIWDQAGNARPSPHDRAGRGFDYGAEFRKAELDAAIDAAPGLGVPPQEIERQSQLAIASHGTHVASIAAGNRGICRKAYLAGVLIALTEEDLDRRTSFYDSVRLAHAVEYLLALSLELGGVQPLPVCINISLGTNGHAHDASSAVSRWLDSALTRRGRAITVAAGNAGQESPRYDGDIGFIMGRVHAGGRIPAAGLMHDLQWQVVGNQIADLSENELEIWHPAQDRFSVRLKPPGDADWLPWVAPGEFIENHQLASGAYVSVYNEVYHHANGENYIAVYLSPLFSADGIVGVPAGIWTVRMRGDEVHDGTFHAWIERDDPRRLGPIGDRMAWRFPSFFAEGSYVDESTVSSLACGQRVISVANLDEATSTMNVTSSQGPTRDGRPKPDVAAPGTNILAARGFDPVQRWVRMSGTSMASPYACGVVGLMLAVNPGLTAAQINGIIRRTAKPPPGSDYAWKNDSGFGVIDPAACIREASEILDRSDVTP